MKITRITAANFLGLQSVDVALTQPIGLFAGSNFSGKSSIQEAVRMALTGDTVRVALKKEYGQLLREGQDSGFIEIQGTTTDPDAPEWMAGLVLPSGKATGKVPVHASAALPYVLDAQRFARLPDQERRAYLFDLMSLSAGGQAVKERLLARECDPDMIIHAMPLLRAGFAAACEEAKGKARDAKSAWRTVTGETYGSQKGVTWKAEKPHFNEAALTKAQDAMNATSAGIEAVNVRLGDLQGQQRQAADQAGKLASLRERAGKYARIQDKLNRDTKERNEWKAKVEATRVAAGQPSTDKPMACPHCSGLVVHRPNMVGAELQPYEQPKTDPEAAAKLPEYEKALALLESAVTNGQRDLSEADAAAKAIEELEKAGLVTAPDDAELTAANKHLVDLRAELATNKAALATLQEAEGKAKQADEKTKSAAKHHADVAAWEKIGDALAPDGIPGDMLAEALGPINKRLAQSGADTEWLTVSIAADMTINTSGSGTESAWKDRPYALLSESEKWRADAMIAEAIANLSGIKLLVLDRFDVLDIKGREDLLIWLDILAQDKEIDTALIFGTLKALPASLPATISAHWIENGIIEELKAAT